MKKKVFRQVTLYGLLGIVLALAILISAKLLTSISVGADNLNVSIEADLQKYINYKLSEEDKGTLVQYNVKNGIEQEEDQEDFYVKATEMAIEVNQIDGKYPHTVKVITNSTELTNGKNNGIQDNYTYDANTGTIMLYANNQNENGEIINNAKPNRDSKDSYTIICYYDTYIEESVERELDLKVSAKSMISIEDRLIERDSEFKGKVKDNKGKLTSIESKTDEIYNGYIKSNKINNTNYTTQFKQTEEITISKKEAQEKLKLEGNQSFVRIYQNNNGEQITQDLGNNGELVYKSTKINKEEITKLLGEEGVIELYEILPDEEKLIETIKKETEFEEDGSKTIYYQDEPIAIAIKTSKIQNEGILKLENSQEIKATMINADNNIKVKTQETIIGTKAESYLQGEETVTEDKQVLEENFEIVTDIKDSQSNVDIKVSNTEWTNKQQNEVTFDIYANSNTIRDNMLKNPSIRIELPEQVEKVILGESSVVYANGLELEEPYLETNENGNTVIVANLKGEQTTYDENALGLVTDVKISATIILKKDIESTENNINFNYTNEFTLNKTADSISKEIGVKITSYQEEQSEQNANIQTISSMDNAISGTSNIEGLEVEVVPTKGDTNVENGDILYEGEYIKYNVKIINTSNQKIDNIKIVGNIPNGTIYGQLDTDYNAVHGTKDCRYQYNFDDKVKTKEIEVGSLEAGESTTTFYEVQVKDLEDQQTELQTKTNIKTYVGQTEVASYELNNVIRPAEAKVFIQSFLGPAKFQWYYYLEVTSEKQVETVAHLKVPKGYTLDGLGVDEGKVDLKEYTTISEDGKNIDVNIQTNKVYRLYFTILPSQLEQKTKESEVELDVTANIEINGTTYRSNENRILLQYESVSISMSSPTEEEEVNFEDEINYEIKITANEGFNNKSDPGYSSIPIHVTDFLPEELRLLAWNMTNGKKFVVIRLEIQTITYQLVNLQKVQLLKILTQL